MPDSERPLPPVPESRGISRKRTRISLVWFIPVVAAALGVWVAVTRVLGEGPKITIILQSADHGIHFFRRIIDHLPEGVGIIFRAARIDLFCHPFPGGDGLPKQGRQSGLAHFAQGDAPYLF